MKPFRSAAGWLFGWAWIVLSAALFADLAVRGRDRSSLVAAAALLLGCGVAYVLGLRPRVTSDAAGVTVVNPLRTTVVPWGAVEAVEGPRTLVVRYAGGRVAAWAVQASVRSASRAEKRQPDPGLPADVAERVKGRTAVDFAVEYLGERRAEAGPGDGRATVSWSIPALAALIVPIVLLGVLIVT